MTRKFYRTEFTFVVLSEDTPVSDGIEPEEILAETRDGEWSGQMTRTNVRELTPLEAAAALIEQGSDPEFFGLDAEGQEIVAP